METEKKKPKGYAQIGISHETYDKLTRVKERKSKEVGSSSPGTSSSDFS